MYTLDRIIYEGTTRGFLVVFVFVDKNGGEHDLPLARLMGSSDAVKDLRIRVMSATTGLSWNTLPRDIVSYTDALTINSILRTQAKRK